MNCEQVVQILQNSLDSKSLALPRAVQVHLESCEQCAVRLSDVRQIDAALRGSPTAIEDRVPNGFHARLMDKLNEETPHRQTFETAWSNRLWVATFAAAAVVLCVVGLRTWQMPGSIQPSKPAHIAAYVTPSLMPTTESAATPDQIAAANTLIDLGDMVREAEVPTPERIYASAGANLSDFTSSIYRATTSLADSLSDGASAAQR